MADRLPSVVDPDEIAELIRGLEVTVTRRLDGLLHGQHTGLTPGHGSEPGDTRRYQPGDDVRRIDWNVTARTREPHVRELIADRDLEAWLVIDTSASMRFGTARTDKATLALAATAAIGFLTARNQNRLGAVLAGAGQNRVLPPRGGRTQVRAILAAVAADRSPDGSGPAPLGAAIDRVGAISVRRGFVAIISDFRGREWQDPLRRLGTRHELLAIETTDPRELDVPPIGLVQLTDPATGRRREVRVTPAVQRRYAEAAQQRGAQRHRELRRAGADLLTLRTDEDWLGTIVRHVQRRRVQVTQLGRVGLTPRTP